MASGTKVVITRQAAPLREQAVEAIRQQIVAAEYLPGSRLKEKDLCDALGVSRTVIREALRQLESERLIRLEPNVGPVVVTLSIKDAQDLYETRAALEGTAAKLAARVASPEQVEELTAVFDEITVADPTDLSGLITLKNNFYTALIEASGNAVIGEMFHNVQARISQLRRMTLGEPGRHARTLQELAAVLEAIKAGDGDAAFAATVVHVKSAESIAMQQLRGAANGSSL